MHYTQNEKILKLTEKTLIIGVDIASQLQYARAFDYRGIELRTKPFKFTNDIDGFASFTSWIKDIKKQNHKQDVLVGMEPTGHYWFTFAQHLKDHQMEVVLVNPYHVKQSKELDDNSPTKTDRKDPKTIAMLIKDGRYMEPYIPQGVYSELRKAMDIRHRIVNDLNAIRNQVKKWIKVYFPEFDEVFGDWEGKAAMMTLDEFPLPAMILEKTPEEIVAHWKKEISRAVGLKRAVRLMEAARNTIGIRESQRTAKHEMEFLLEKYELLQKQYEKAMTWIEELARQIPGIEEMLKIKGVGLVTAAGFVAEVGDIGRFEHAKQVQKFAGLNLKENSSGKHKGTTTISKRGRKRLRALLFQGIMPLVAKNEQFKELHQYYTTRAVNPLKKKQSLILLCCKLIRIFFALLRKKVAFDPQKMMSDIVRPTLLEAA